ncbi:DUF7373 family lipoprotein [Nocardia cyriacigeorgica]|uniref:DUF7373 family lipoprotein n=1 Tax=Nocardia cyriacigeorgica TaxID=135487 RepID=UPI0018936D31|nr:hypothetical protein [Nocardia cyriacigeorgica]MBF6290075.1 hypothetical protein [Nocardia cyriacigeorgica]
MFTQKLGNKAGRRLLCTSAAALTLAMTVTGCGSAIDGKPIPGMTPVQLDQLDYGDFIKEPSDYEPRTALMPADVFNIEARRMLDYLISPYQVDPVLQHLEHTKLLGQRGAIFSDSVTGILPAAFEPIAKRNFFFTGVSTQRSNLSLRKRESLSVAIMRFGSDALAQSAANEFDAALGQMVPERKKLSIPGHDKVVASARDDSKGWAFAVGGPYVIVSSAVSSAGQPSALPERFAKLFDLQLKTLESLKPTPPNDILDLPQNPEGILRLPVKPSMLATDSFSTSSDYVGVYGTAGFSHFATDAKELGSAITDAGVDLIAHVDGTLFRTRDLEAAFKLQTALAALGKDDEEIPPPPGIADARCIKRDEPHPVFNSEFECVLVYDRYVAVLRSGGMGTRLDPVLYRRTAAQLSILAQVR